MDIEFFCSHCGQSLSIDESGAGITVDCPKCSKPAYVPSAKLESAPAKPPEPPTRVQPKKPLSQPPRAPAVPKRQPAPETLPGHDLALSTEETVVLQARMHGIVVALPGILFAVLGVFFLVLSAGLNYLMHVMFGALTGGQPGSMVGGFGFIFILPFIPLVPVCVVLTVVAWLARIHTLVTLTSRRLIINQGVLSRTTAELLLKQMETVAIRLPLLGRIFGYGTVVVRGTGGGVFRLLFMQEPQQLYASLQNRIEVSK